MIARASEADAPVILAPFAPCVDELASDGHVGDPVRSARDAPGILATDTAADKRAAIQRFGTERKDAG